MEYLDTTGRIFDVQRYSIHDGPGIRTIVFLKGCVLRCQWCCNPESQRIEPDVMYDQKKCIGCGKCMKACQQGAIGPENLSWVDRSKCIGCGECVNVCPTGALTLKGEVMSVNEIIQVLRRDAHYFRKSGGGVTLSGGEPLTQWRFARELLKACKAQGWDTAIETTAYGTDEAIEAVIPYVDLVLMDIRNGVCCGAHKPSSEKGVHLAAYQTFPEVGYVIHTHQTYATAIGLCGFEQLAMTEEEAEKLGGIARAAYGLSSTEKLAGAVYDAMQSGAKVVFMVHHGVLICGKDREEAFSRAMLLEEICKRSILGQPKKKPRKDQKRQEKLLHVLQKHFHYVGICDTPAVLLCAASGRGIPAQVDDMAQMIGRKIPCCLHVRRDMLGLLRKYGAVLVPRVGVVVSAGTADDVEALRALVAKAAVCCLHVRATGASASLSPVNVAIQHHHYVKKYALQKDGEA